MYIVKNALKCISRSKGRNVLIGIIILVIAISACIGLSIRQAAESAKTDMLSGMEVTGTISYDRQSVMANMRDQGSSGTFDRSQFASMMGETSSLSLAEYQSYTSSDSVKDFYYTLTASLDGTDTFLPVSTDTSDISSEVEQNSMMGGETGMPGMMSGMMVSSGDFQLIGYSDESAMTAFISGTSSVVDGTVFAEATSDNTCIISEELAIYNNLAIGNTITVCNPNNETELYVLTVVGIYSDTTSNESSSSNMKISDPANNIYMSYQTLQSIIDASSTASVIVTDETTGVEYDSLISGTLSGIYVFEDVDDYYQFEEDVVALGLADNYTVSSADLAAYESSLTPLNTLSTMAIGFLLVVLIIGAIILVVLNIFNVRERKYEIGVLTAMGMKKSKVAMQFLTEIFVVTIAAVIIGAGIGAACSVPVTNALLENQVESQTSQSVQVEKNFGRGSSDMGTGSTVLPSMTNNTASVNYVSEINTAMNITVVLQMLGIAILLTLVAGAASMLFVMRYEPLKILSNRD